MKSYILATTGDRVRWYQYDPTRPEAGFSLSDVLNLKSVPVHADKQQAKAAAKMLGLTTWRYFSF